MDSNYEMRKFIQAAFEYSKHRGDLSEVQKYLQNLAAVTDSEVFDPSLREAAHFFVCLHDLMNNLDAQSMLVWSAITVLQNACANPKAKEALIQTYKFIPVLSRFLSTNHNSEKQLRLLQVLSELTYGVQITWQEAHLNHLILTLVQIILGSNTEHKAQALVVLVNLCYRNLPVLYVLVRKVDLNKFIRSITAMSVSPSSRMHACKMFIILSEIKGQMPDEEILKFVDIAFNCASDSFQRRDSFTLRQITDFFYDMNKNSTVHHIISRYAKTKEDIKRLLDIIENIDEPDSQTAELVAILLSFIETAFKINISITSKLIPRLLDSIMPLLRVQITLIPAVRILAMVTQVVSSREVSEANAVILPKLSESLAQLLSSIPQEDLALLSEKRLTQLTSIFSLLSEMATASSELKSHILNSISCEMTKACCENLYRSNDQTNGILKPDNNKLAIQILYLVYTFSNFSEDWMKLYMELLSKRQVLLSIAVAILNGDKAAKFQMLRLVGSAGWGTEALKSLCDIMSQMRPDSDKIEICQSKLPNTTVTDCMPLFVSESRLNELLDSLQGVSLSDTPASALMELYEYKLATMGHAERQVLAAIEAADARCIGLNHQVAQLRGDVSHLHKLLFQTQQTAEGSAAEKNALIHQLEQIKTIQSAEKLEQRRKVKELERIIYEKHSELELKDNQLQRELSRNAEISTNLQTNKVELEEVKSKLAEALKNCEQLLLEKTKTESALQKAENDIIDFKAENEEIRKTLSQCVEKSSQKDIQLADFQKQIHYLEQIREAVINVAGRKEKF